MKLTYTGKAELAPNLTRLLTDEGLAVSPDPDSTSPSTVGHSAVQIYEVTMPAEVPPEWQVVLTTAEVAVSRFRELFPDAGGAIDFESEATDANTPAPNLAWHVAT